MRLFRIFILIVFFSPSYLAFGQGSIDLLRLIAKERSASPAGRKANPNHIASNGLNIDVIQYVCHWLINPSNDSIRGKVCIVFSARENGLNEINLDMDENLKVSDTKFRNSSVIAESTNGNTLRIDLSPHQMAQNEVDSVIIWYRGIPVPSPFGSYTRTLHNDVPIIYTLSEPFGAKDWWPCKQSLEDKADSIDFTISCPAEFMAVSNGLLVSQTNSGELKSYRWKHKYPCVTYLMALAVTNYQHFRLNATLSSGDTLPIDHYCYPESFATWSVEMPPIVGMMQYLDSMLVPYPFAREKYGHAEFSFGGGMEHQTISFMQNTSIGLQAHELAHHWFGNLVTCGSWKEIWLNEGFATFLAAQEEVRNGVYTWPAIADSWTEYFLQDPSGSVYCPDTTDIFRIFNGRLSYIKGGYVLNMLKFNLGDNVFYQALRQYLNDPDLRYGFATTSKLKAHFEQVSGQNLTEFFKDWIYSEGYPSFQIQSGVNGQQVQVLVSQSSSHPSVSLFEGKIPIWYSNGVQDTLVIIDIQENNQQETLNLPFEPTQVKFDPEKQILAKWTGSLVTGHSGLLKNPPALIFPNPAKGFILLKNISPGTQIEILDALGRKVFSRLIELEKEYFSPGFSPGLYRVNLFGRESQTSHSILVE